MKQTLNCGGRLLDLSSPVVMGILNATPDSFFSKSRVTDEDALLKKAEQMLSEGAAILDLGAVSTRPGALPVNADEERKRLLPALRAVISAFPEAIVSVDTSSTIIAREAVDGGAAIINDVSGGTFDTGMFETAAALKVPYILMHIRGEPSTMQQNPTYHHIITEVTDYFLEKTGTLRSLGVTDIILDPGFGFGKNLDHNYTLLKNLSHFGAFGYPLLAGISRKSMVNQVLGTTPGQALNGTTALNVIALLNGAGILRVHDVKEAVEAVKVVEKYKRAPGF